MRPAKSQSKWYRLFSDHKVDPTAVLTWSTDSSRLIQDIFHKNLCEDGRSQQMICNQAASFNRCLFKVQQDMQSQLKTVRTKSKGKSSSKVSTAMNELQYLMNFNASIILAAAKTMECLYLMNFNPSIILAAAKTMEFLLH